MPASGEVMGGARGRRATVHQEGFDRACTGDRPALEDLVRRQWPRVHRILAAETGSTVEADDLTQEAFARVLPRLRAFAAEGAMAAYLDTVARNLVRDRYRRRRFLADAPVDDRPTSAPGPEAEVLTGLDGESVRAALRRLPADYRTVLRLRLEEGLSSQDVALAMGRSGAAVRQLQHRALVALRRELDGTDLRPAPGAGTGEVAAAAPDVTATAPNVTAAAPDVTATAPDVTAAAPVVTVGGRDLRGAP